MRASCGLLLVACALMAPSVWGSEPGEATQVQGSRDTDGNSAAGVKLMPQAALKGSAAVTTPLKESTKTERTPQVATETAQQELETDDHAAKAESATADDMVAEAAQTSPAESSHDGVTATADEATAHLENDEQTFEALPNSSRRKLLQFGYNPSLLTQAYISAEIQALNLQILEMQARINFLATFNANLNQQAALAFSPGAGAGRRLLSSPLHETNLREAAKTNDLKA